MFTKYISNSLRSLFLKGLFVFCITSLSFSSSSQITNGNVDPDKQKDTTKNEKIKKDRTFSEDSLTGTNFYLTGMYQYSHRSFKDESGFEFYKDWENQTSGYSGGANAGLIMEVSNHFHLDIGISYFGSSENYHFQDSLSDSSYTYKNTYMQVALPIRVRYVIGEKLQFFAFAGVAPLNILNIRYKSSYFTTDSISVEREIEIQKGTFASFNLMLSAGFGICYNIKYIGFTLYPEFRRNLLNTYSTKTVAMDHKLYGLGINAGIVLHF